MSDLVLAAILIIGCIVILISSVILLINHRSVKKASNLLGEWDGWIQLSDDRFEPIFQGKIIGHLEDSKEMLLVGVLIEENLSDIQREVITALRPSYLSKNRILVRCVTNHQQDVILSHMEDVSVKSMVSPFVNQTANIDLRILINSKNFVLPTSQDEEKSFDRAWLDIVQANREAVWR